MSTLIPLLSPPQETGAAAPHAEAIKAANAALDVSRRLLAHTTALVLFPSAPNNLHLLQRNAGGDRESWSINDDVLGQLAQADYPRFSFPSWSLYAYWRAGKPPKNEQVNESYGYHWDSWLEHLSPGSSTILRTVTPFHAIRRSFGDHSEADHLEIRTPASPMVLARVPGDEYERILTPEGHPSRAQEYASFWLPQLVMDSGSAAWHEKREAARAKEQAEHQAEQLAKDQADEVLREVARKFRPDGLDEAA